MTKDKTTKAKAPLPKVEGTGKARAAASSPDRRATVIEGAKTADAEPAAKAPHATMAKASGDTKASSKPRRGAKPALQVEAPSGKEPPRTSPASDGDAGATSPASAVDGTRTAAAGGFPSWLRRTFPGHEHAVIGGLIGLALALLVFLVGFWQTLFVALLVAIGVMVGQYVDGDPKIVDLLRSVVRALGGADQDS